MPNISSEQPTPQSELAPQAAHFLRTTVAAIQSLRPYQWSKNLLVFVPLIAAHRLADTTLLGVGARAFVAFSLCASAIYLFNDLHDLEADRAHPHKRSRPIPSGRLPKVVAIALIPLLLITACLIAATLGADVLMALVAYQLLMAAYTLRLKAIILLDALVLASGYALRVFVGALAVEIMPSARLLAFCIFLFFSLALVKRYAELSLMKLRDGESAHARAYRIDDQDFVLTLGISCGALSVLVLALYLGPMDVDHAHFRSQLTWVSCVALLYWISHIWLTAHRGRMTDDPLIFAIRNRTSIVLLSIVALSAWLAV